MTEHDEKPSPRVGVMRFSGSALNYGVAARLPLYVFLTLLVWGIGPCRRGPWQDEVPGLANGEDVASGKAELFAPTAAPTRRLQRIPFALAALSGHPVVFLQLLLGITWLAQGLIAHGLIRELLPTKPEAALLAAVLTLTATADQLTDSLVGTAYFIGSVELAAAVWCALVALRVRRWTWGAASCALLAASLFTVDVALPALPFAALLLLWAYPRQLRPAAVLIVGWALVLAPYLLLFVPFVQNPASYAGVAVLQISPAERLANGLDLWLANFTPWRWSLAKQAWWGRVDRTYPAAWYWLASFMALSAFLASAWRLVRSPQGERASSLRLAVLTVLLLAAAFATNTAYGSVQYGEVHYRTHIAARVWASLGLAGAAAWLWQLHAVARWLATATVGAFVGWGVWTGVARQDFYRTSWSHHQRELVSIVQAVPDIQPAAHLLLWKPNPSRIFGATEAQYLARAWMEILYGGGRERSDRTFVWAPALQHVCQVKEGGWQCPSQRGAVATLPFGETVVLRYDEVSGTYSLLESLPPELGGDDARIRDAYRGPQLVIGGPLQRKQRRALLLD